LSDQKREQKKMGEAEELLALWKKRPSPKAHTHFYFKHEYIKWIANFEPKFEAFLLLHQQRETELRKLKKDLGKMREKTPAFGETVRLALVLDHIIKRLDGLNLGKEVNK